MDETKKALGLGDSTRDAMHRKEMIAYADALDRIAKSGSPSALQTNRAPSALDDAYARYSATYWKGVNRLTNLGSISSEEFSGGKH